MPTIQESVDLLFNKVFARKGTVVNSDPTKSNPYYAEYYASKQTIGAEQIWTQSKLIPQDRNPLSHAPRIANTLRSTSAYVDRIDGAATDSPVLVVNDQPLIQRLDLRLKPLDTSPFAWAFGKQGGTTDLTPGGLAGNPAAEWVSTFGAYEDFTGYNIIPFSYDPSATLYQYELYLNKTDGLRDNTWGTSYTLSNKVNVFDASGWFFDPDALVLNFTNRVLPIGMQNTPTQEIFIRVYRYIGKVGEFGSSTGTGSLQVSAVAYMESASSAQDIDHIVDTAGGEPDTTPGLLNEKKTVYAYVANTFSHPDAPLVSSSTNFNAGQVIRFRQTTNKWEVYSVPDGARFLVRSENLSNVATYAFGPPVVVQASATVLKNSVIEYWKGSVRGTAESGFSVLTPALGWRISITEDANKTWEFDGSNWIELIVASSMGALTNKDMTARNTGAVIPTSGPTVYNIKAVNAGLLEVPSGDNTSPGYIEVQVNGVAIKLGDGYVPGFNPSACFAKEFITGSFLVSPPTSGVVTLDFGAINHAMSSGDYIAFINASGITITPVTAVDAFKVTVAAANAPNAGTPTFFLKKYSNVKVQDTLVWFGNWAKYELDDTDRISYIYVSAA